MAIRAPDGAKNHLKSKDHLNQRIVEFNRSKDLDATAPPPPPPPSLLGFTGLYWAALGCIGLYSAVLDCIGLYWALLRQGPELTLNQAGWGTRRGSNGLCWALLDCTGIYWTVLGCTRLY